VRDGEDREERGQERTARESNLTSTQAQALNVTWGSRTPLNKQHSTQTQLSTRRHHTTESKLPYTTETHLKFNNIPRHKTVSRKRDPRVVAQHGNERGLGGVLCFDAAQGCVGCNQVRVARTETQTDGRDKHTESEGENEVEAYVVWSAQFSGGYGTVGWVLVAVL
jgi:hypothetical protein